MSTDSGESPLSHALLDRKSLEMHRLACDLMRAQPSRLGKAQCTLDRWLQDHAASHRPYLLTWHKAFSQGLDCVVRLATDDTEYGRAHRQASPVCTTLTNDERFAFLRKWKEQHATS